MAQIKITVVEALKWVVGELKNRGLSLVPDEAQLEILTERMAAEKDEKLRKYHEALRAEVELENPSHPEEGRLPNLRARLARREKQGQEAADELKAGAKGKRAVELKSRMEQCASEMGELEQEIAALERLLAERKETTQMRKAAYLKAKAGLKRLREVGPTVLARAKAFEDAERDRLRAIEESGQGSEGDVDALLDQLEQRVEKAQASDAAAEIIVDEEEEQEPDLDEVEEEEQAERRQDERIARWMAPATS